MNKNTEHQSLTKFEIQIRLEEEWFRQLEERGLSPENTSWFIGMEIKLNTSGIKALRNETNGGLFFFYSEGKERMKLREREKFCMNMSSMLPNYSVKPISV